jgi:hypothetical protein
LLKKKSLSPEQKIQSGQNFVNEHNLNLQNNWIHVYNEGSTRTYNIRFSNSFYAKRLHSFGWCEIEEKTINNHLALSLHQLQPFEIAITKTYCLT